MNSGQYDPEDLKRAAQILDLSLAAGFTEEDVKRQWRKLIERVHPDAGGSNYFAEEANLARDVLLGWIAGGRRTASAPPPPPPPPGAEARAEAGRSSNDGRKSSAGARAASGVFKLVKGAAEVIFGLLIWAVIIRVGYSYFSNKDAKPEQATLVQQALPMVWQRSRDEQNDDGSIIHAVQRVLFGSGNNDAVTLYIACATKDVSPAQVIKLMLGAGGSIELETVKYRRSDDNDPAEGVVADNKHAAGMTFITPVETMSNDQMANEFGPMGLVLAGKWLLTSSSRSEISGDIISVLRSHYQPIFGGNDLILEVVYKDSKGEHRYNETIGFSGVQQFRDELFRACQIRNPYLVK